MASLGSLAGPRVASRGWLALAALITLVFAVFWQTEEFSFLKYDDDRVVTGNPVVSRGLTTAGVVWAFTTASEGNWFPLTWISHMAAVELFGMDPAAHHLVNLGLHLAVTLLLHSFLVGLTGNHWRSLLAAAIFAVHPLHVESVAWVNQRKDLLMAFFGMLTLHAYLADLRRPRTARKYVTMAAFACGLMSKALLVTLPLLLLLLDFWPLGRLPRQGTGPIIHNSWTAARGFLVEKLPMLALALVAGGLAFMAQSGAGGMPFPDLSILTRFAHSVVSLAWYLVKGLVPAGLAAFYPYPLAGHPPWQVVGGGALLAAVTFGALAVLRRIPAVLVGWLWYLVSLLPVSGLVQVGRQAWAERYSYFALAGLCIVAAWSAAVAGRRRGGIALSGAIVAVLALSVAAFEQARSWRDDGTLWTRALRVTRGNYVAHNNLGTHLLSKGRPDEAYEEFLAAFSIMPDSGQTLNNLGLMHALQGRFEEAVATFQAALQRGPAPAKVHRNLGMALARLGRQDEAAAAFRRALAQEPDDPQTLHLLGVSLARLGLYAEAVRMLERAVEEDQENATYAVALAVAREQLRLSEAVNSP